MGGGISIPTTELHQPEVGLGWAVTKCSTNNTVLYCARLVWGTVLYVGNTNDLAPGWYQPDATLVPGWCQPDAKSDSSWACIVGVTFCYSPT